VYAENEGVHALCTALTGSRSPARTGHSTGLQGDSSPMKDRHTNTPDNQSCRSLSSSQTNRYWCNRIKLNISVIAHCSRLCTPCMAEIRCPVFENIGKCQQNITSCKGQVTHTVAAARDALIRQLHGSTARLETFKNGPTNPKLSPM